MQKIKADNKYREKELINRLEVGDKKLLLSSDSQHVEMSTNRTLEEEYTSLLGRFGKEIDSPDGGSVQVNDGISGKVLNMSIKGQTVKNLLPTEFATTKKTITTDFADVNLDLSLFKPNTQYDFVVSVSKNTLNKAFNLYNSYNGFFNSSYSLEAGKTGIIRFSKTTIAHMVGTRFLMGSIDETRTGEIVIDWVAVVEVGSGQFVTSATSFGLSSTEAIISNNRQSYPVYEPTIQGKTRILDADTGLVPTDPTLPALKDGDVLDLATRTITFANKTTRVLTDEEVKAYDAYRKIITLNAI